MKKTHFRLLLIVAIMSACGNNNRSQTSLYSAQSTEPDSIFDIRSEESSSDAGQIMTIPNGFTTGDVRMYVPKDNEEKAFMRDMMKLQSSCMNNDIQTVMDMIYPDSWKDMQEQMPEYSIAELKQWYRANYLKLYKQQYDTALSLWNEAKRYSTCITKIINRVQEGKNILYLYETYMQLFSDTDSIKSLEPTYFMAASVDGGKHWHEVPSEGFHSLLHYRFSDDAIDKVQRKD